MPELNDSKESGSVKTVSEVQPEHHNGNVVKVEASSNVKKNKRGTGWKIATAMLGVLTLGLAGFGIYHFVSTEHGEKQCEEQVCEVTEVKDEETGEVIKVVKVPVGQKDDDVAVRAIADEIYNVAVGILYPGQTWHPNITKTYNELHLAYKPEGLKVLTGLDLTYGFKVVSEDNKPSLDSISAMESTIRQILMNDGFVEYEQSPMYAREYINEKTGIICGSVGAGLPYGFACSSVNWYTVGEWDLLNELAEAFKAKEGHYPLSIGASVAKIEDSGYGQYQRLQGSVENAMGLFYRVNPESEWIFFRGAQAVIPCSEFDTDDLKRAFMGYGCYDENTKQNGTVKP